MVTELKGEGFAELQNQRRPLEQSAALVRDTVGSNFAGGLLIELDGLSLLWQIIRGTGFCRIRFSVIHGWSA